MVSIAWHETNATVFTDMNKHTYMMSVGPSLDAALAELKRRDIKFLNCERAPNGNWIFRVMVNPEHFKEQQQPLSFTGVETGMHDHPQDPNGTYIKEQLEQPEDSK